MLFLNEVKNFPAGEKEQSALVVNYIHPSFIRYHCYRVTIVLCILICITCMFGSHAMLCLDYVLMSRDCRAWICFPKKASNCVLFFIRCHQSNKTILIIKILLFPLMDDHITELLPLQ